VPRRLRQGEKLPVECYGELADSGAGHQHNGYFTSLKAIVHFYNTRDVLPRCQPHDVGEGTTCWPAPESTYNMNTSRVGRLVTQRRVDRQHEYESSRAPGDAEEDAMASFRSSVSNASVNRRAKISETNVEYASEQSNKSSHSRRYVLIYRSLPTISHFRTPQV
jgi:hypothetical protein